MRKAAFAMMAIAGALLAIAREQPAGKPALTPAEKAALRKKVAILKGGEKIARPGTQQGVVTMVNAQGRASPDWIAATVAYLTRETRFRIELREGAFDAARPATHGQMTIYVIDDPDLPRTMIAPEDRWACCNIARLHSDKAAFFEARTRKALARTFAMLCGGMSSAYAISLVGPMPDVTDLDVIPNEHIPVEVTIRMEPYMEKFGVTPAVMKPYRIAVEEGWAPAPTNDVQRAIWEKVHAVPDKPITIEYDPKKDK